MHLVMRGAWFKSTQCRPCSYRVIKRISCPRSCPARRQARHNRHDLYEFSQWEGSSRTAAGAHAWSGPYKYECLADHRQFASSSKQQHNNVWTRRTMIVALVMRRGCGKAFVYYYVYLLINLLIRFFPSLHCWRCGWPWDVGVDSFLKLSKPAAEEPKAKNHGCIFKTLH